MLQHNPCYTSFYRQYTAGGLLSFLPRFVTVSLSNQDTKLLDLKT
jgi:hypothetical protein